MGGGCRVRKGQAGGCGGEKERGKDEKVEDRGCRRRERGGGRRVESDRKEEVDK